MPPSQVVIVGGGLAGPALALALARQSIRSTVLERHDSVQDIGGVIMLAPNAMYVMDKLLGVADTLRSKGAPFDVIELLAERDGASLEHIGGIIQNTKGYSAVSIARPDIHHTLVDACLERGIDLRFSTRLDHIEETSDGVVAVLEGGERVEGDVLIGADGIGSRVRDHVLGEKIIPTYSGFLTLGAITRRDDVILPDSWQLPAFCYTRHGTFLSFAMDTETLQWATSVQIPERERKHGWEEYRASGQAVKDMKQKYADTTAEPIKSFIDSLDDEQLRVWAPYQIPELPKWHTARVCILGDAAHAIPPSAGQGAAQAFEDIGYMARLLAASDADDGGYDEMFAKFENVRRKRVEIIRQMTARAESSRGESGAVMWWVKRMALHGLFWWRGDKGYVKSSEVVDYDVTEEPV